MDDMQLRFLTAQALYGKDLQERTGAIRMLQQSDLTAAEITAIGIRLELALSCQDEYVRSAAAMLLASLDCLPASPEMIDALLKLSRAAQPFAREAALRAIHCLHQRAYGLAAEVVSALESRLEEARQVEGEGFALSLFDE